VSNHIRSNVVGYVAVFIALSGTAYAVDGPLAGQNTVGSADIINGEVTNDDLGADAVGSGKIADRQVKNQDLSIGASSSNTIADGGVQGIDVKNDDLTGADVANDSLTGADVDEDTLVGGPTNPTGPAGGDLDGTYPNPVLRDGAVTPSKVSGIPTVRVQQDDSPITPQSIPNAAFTDAVFQEEIYDTDAMFNPAAHDRITIRTDGVYALTGAVRWDADAAGVRTVGLVPNDLGFAFLAADTSASTGGTATRQNVSTVTRLQDGDFIQLTVQQNSGDNLEIDNIGSPQVHLSATWLAP
jgi:hypothetical protein